MAKYIITIGRQLGSGGAEIGQKLADILGFKYIDREIISKASEILAVPEKNLESMEEKTHSIWESLWHAGLSDLSYLPEDFFMPTGRQLFDAQTKAIKEMTSQNSCVIVGRCGSEIFREHPGHISVFLHGADEFRINRMKDILQKSEEETLKAIRKEDKARARYYNTYTGREWLDASAYDLCIETSKIGIEGSIEIIKEYIFKLFPELKI